MCFMQLDFSDRAPLRNADRYELLKEVINIRIAQSDEVESSLVWQEVDH